MQYETNRVAGREPGTRLRPSGALEGSSGFVNDTPTSLTQAVRTAVRATDERLLRFVARRDAGLAFEPRTLLALLSYCYARDIFGSADVEDVLRRDTHFRHLCNNEFPGARLLRRFRRDNREALHRCLTSALRARAGLPTESARADEANDPEFAEDATRRIMKAMFIDSMALEQD